MSASAIFQYLETGNYLQAFNLLILGFVIKFITEKPLADIFEGTYTRRIKNCNKIITDTNISDEQKALAKLVNEQDSFKKTFEIYKLEFKDEIQSISIKLGNKFSLYDFQKAQSHFIYNDDNLFSILYSPFLRIVSTIFCIFFLFVSALPFYSTFGIPNFELILTGLSVSVLFVFLTYLLIGDIVASYSAADRIKKQLEELNKKEEPIKETTNV
jgi:hypothetical protein